MPTRQEQREARDRERREHARFAREFADGRYARVQRRLLDDWAGMNERFFGGKLLEPHIDFAGTPPRSLVTCAETDGSGGEMLITLNAGLVFGTRAGVLRPWPSEGTDRLVRDLFAQGVLRQWVREGLAPHEREENSFDALLAREATRVGISLGLPQVSDRNRPGRPPRPLAKFWPCCVRPRRGRSGAGYYLGDVTAELEDAARGDAGPRRRPLTTPGLGVLEFVRYLLDRGRAEAARQLLARHVEWVRMFEPARRRRIPEPPEGFEEMKADTGGGPLEGEVAFDPAWLDWNGGTVGLIARGIRRYRSFAELPILADALEEAGCREGRLLRHLREKVAHTAGCWALRLVLALDGGEPEHGEPDAPVAAAAE